MARPKKKNSSYEVRKKSKEGWEAASPEQWLNFAKQHDPRAGKQIKFSGTSLLTSCINGHSDSTPSMYIHPQKGFVKCFSCGYYEWNCVRFWSAFSGKSNAEIAKEIQATFDVKFLSKTELKTMEEEFRHLLIKKWLAVFFNEELVEARNKWFECDKDPAKFAQTDYYYCEHTLKFIEQRGLIEGVHFLPIGIFPTIKRLEELAASRIDQAGKKVFSGHEVQELKKYVQDYGQAFYLGALVMIYHSSPTDVSRFRLRIPREDDPAKAIIELKDAREDRLGVFGLGMYGHLKQTTGEGIGNTTKAIMVEGEFDQMHYAMKAAEAGDNDVVILSHAGAAGHDFSELANYGIKNIYYVPDYDEGGERQAKEVMTVNPGMQFRIFQWPQGLLDPAKPKTDLDDALTLYGFDAVKEALVDWDTPWVKPAYWAKEQVKKKIARAGIEEDMTAVSKVVFDFAPCIGDTKDGNQALQVQSWVNQILTEMGLSGNDAQKIANEYISRESPEQVFCNRIRDKLVERFEFVAIDRSRSTLPVKVWEKQSHYLMDIRMGSDAHVKASLAVSIGKLVDWVKDEIGVPDFIKYSAAPRPDMEPAERSVTSQEDDIERLVLLTLKEIVSKLPELSAFERYTAGNHWLATESGHALFTVNGKSVIKCTFDEAGNPEFEELISPIHGKYLFDTTLPPWSKVATLENYRKARRMTLTERVAFTANILSTGWTFENQESESLGLAALIAMSAVLKIFPQNLQFLVSNERSTGKSTLYAELIGGGKGTDLNLVEHVRFVDNATPAGIRQSMDGSSLMLVIDEFDNQIGGRFRSEKMEEIMTILRTCSSGEGKYLQGTVGGEAKVFRLSFTAMIAGIDPDVTDANMTRFFTTDLKSGLDNRVPPRESIFQKFSVKDLEMLRHANTLDAPHDVPLFIRSYNEVRKYCFEHPELFGEASLQRFKDTMMVLMACLHAAKMDWKGWCEATCKAKAKAIKRLSKRTANESLIHSVLYTPSIDRTGMDQKRMMVAQFFVLAPSVDEREILNNSGSGVYIYEDYERERWYLLIIWQEAVGGVLRGTSMLRVKDNPHALQSIAERHPLALPKEVDDDVLERLHLIPAYVKSIPHTFLDITPMVEEENKRRDKALKAIKAKEDKVVSAQKPAVAPETVN